MSRGSDILNKYRAFPRIFAILFGYLLFEVVFWFMNLQAPSIEQAGFASTVIASSVGYFKFYVDSGPSKNKSAKSEEQ